MIYLFLIFAYILYFSLSIFLPWPAISQSISVSYIFDLFFASFLMWYSNSFSLFRIFSIKGFITRNIVNLFCVIIILLSINLFDFVHPFGYLPNKFIQLLILAPIFEELVFRGAFNGLMNKFKLKEIYIHFISAVTFSLSHLPAYFVLDIEFKSFILFQVFYTFILGWICSKSYQKTKGILEPILLHFVFNLAFYWSIENSFI